MDRAGAWVSGGQLGLNTSMVQQSRRRDAFDQQKQMVDNYNSIITQYAQNLEKLKQQTELQMASSTDQDKVRLAEQYKQFYQSTMSNVSRVGQRAVSQGVPIDLPTSLAQLVPYKNLTDLNAVAAQKAANAAKEKGMVAGAESKAKVPYAQAETYTNPNTGDTRSIHQGQLPPDQYVPNRGMSAQRITNEQGGSPNLDESPAWKAFAGKYGAQMEVRMTNADDSIKAIENNQMSYDLIDSGIISGFGGNFRLGFAKALNLAGITDDEKIANSEAYYASRVSSTAHIIHDFGAGTGLSDADREYANSAAAGSKTLNEESMRRIIYINNIAAMETVRKWNDSISAIQERQANKEGFSLIKEMPQVPDFVKKTIAERYFAGNKLGSIEKWIMDNTE